MPVRGHQPRLSSATPRLSAAIHACPPPPYTSVRRYTRLSSATLYACPPLSTPVLRHPPRLPFTIHACPRPPVTPINKPNRGSDRRGSYLAYCLRPTRRHQQAAPGVWQHHYHIGAKMALHGAIDVGGDDILGATSRPRRTTHGGRHKVSGAETAVVDSGPRRRLRPASARGPLMDTCNDAQYGRGARGGD